MYIKFLKNKGFITGFLSHIPKNKLYKHNKKEIYQISNLDYKILFYYLVGRDNVKVKKGVGSVNIGGIDLKDEGKHIKTHEKLQRDIFKHKQNHYLN